MNFILVVGGHFGAYSSPQTGFAADRDSTKFREAAA